jgi:hypothetical protein
MKIRVKQIVTQQEHVFNAYEQRQKYGESFFEWQNRMNCDNVKYNKRAVFNDGQVSALGSHKRNRVIQADETEDNQAEHDGILF